MTDWIKQATEPTPAELEPLEGLPVGLRELAVDATEPLADEVARMRFSAPSRRPGWGWAPVLLTAATALAWVLATSSDPPPFLSEGSAPFHVTENGPSMRVLQGAGTRTYDVLPVRPSGTFSVVYGDVTVTVLGTKFRVDDRNDDVVVTVEEGRVQVDHPWGRAVLSAGDRWSRSDARPELAAVPTGLVRLPERTETVVPATDSRQSALAVMEADVAPPAAPVEPPAEPRSEPAWFAGLLDRFESGERSLDLLANLARFIETGTSSALVEEAEVLALLAGADTWPAQAALDALDAWLARHPRHPDQIRVLVARANVAEVRLGRCALALSTYRRLAQGSTGRLQQESAARAALCAFEVEPDARAPLEALSTDLLPASLRQRVEAALEDDDVR